MPKTRDPNPIAPGAIGAASGAIIGGATAILLTNKKARQKIASKLRDMGDYAQEALSTVGDMAQDNQLRRMRFAGVKGGKSKRSRSKSKP